MLFRSLVLVTGAEPAEELLKGLEAGSRRMSPKTLLIGGTYPPTADRHADARAGQGAGGGSLGLAVVDFDFFKRVTDTYGVASGDAVLQEAANRIGRCVRAYDRVGRMGNQEFVLLLPGCTPHGAQHVAERVRTVLSNSVFLVQDQRIPLTASISVCCSKEPNKVDLLLVRAERALFSAKRSGSNRVVMAEAPA